MMEDKLNVLARVLTEHGLTKISYEEGELRLTLEKAGAPVIQQAVASAPAPVPAAAQAVGTQEIPDDTEAVKAPLAGIYYGKASPEARNFVREGQKVKAGETLCIIESMKIMNEIKAPFDLTVVRILKRDEQVAEYNEELFRVKR